MKGARLFVTRRSAAAVTAAMLITTAFLVLLVSAVDARAQSSPGSCQGAADVAVLPAPVAPWQGAPLRVIFAAEKPIAGELSLIAPDGSVAAKSRDRQGGPPYFWFAEVAAPAAGTWHATLATAGCGAISRDITVRDSGAAAAAGDTGRRVAGARVAWNRDTENSVFGMDPKAVRRAARRRSVVAGAA